MQNSTIYLKWAESPCGLNKDSSGQLQWLHFAFCLLDIFTSRLVSIATVNHCQFGGAADEIPPNVSPFGGVLAMTGTSRLHTYYRLVRR